ncbi:hypothetical protein DPMN_150539 [Dreissena polymorpha]|uniref:Uncharacterized protein n=1 Tax=Dreissena polymorpha TaxID=45954 RepID=A0A9D4FGN0_DREPO|nr:hypothetical protein DPMN_150539 [Dreissena polymorpha]
MRFHAAKSNARFLKGVSSTSSGDTASCRILNTTNIIDPYWKERFHAAKSNARFLKGVSSTSSGDTASCRILNTTNIIDPYWKERGRKAAKSNARFLKGVSSTSSGDTASCRILNTTNIIDPSNQLSCTACMLRNKAKPVQCQLPLPTKHELYV